MSTHRTQEVLYETEAALRLVDHGLDGLREERPEPDHAAPPPPPSIDGGLSELPAILERANAQILGVLARLRESRAALETTALEKLASTHEKIKEVTSATEDAAINIMDACDRATQMVDELDTIDAEPAPDRERAARCAEPARRALPHDGRAAVPGHHVAAARARILGAGGDGAAADRHRAPVRHACRYRCLQHRVARGARRRPTTRTRPRGTPNRVRRSPTRSSRRCARTRPDRASAHDHRYHGAAPHGPPRARSARRIWSATALNNAHARADTEPDASSPRDSGDLPFTC
jgi:hypothetical protein